VRAAVAQAVQRGEVIDTRRVLRGDIGHTHAEFLSLISASRIWLMLRRRLGSGPSSVVGRRSRVWRCRSIVLLRHRRSSRKVTRRSSVRSDIGTVSMSGPRCFGWHVRRLRSIGRLRRPRWLCRRRGRRRSLQSWSAVADGALTALAGLAGEKRPGSSVTTNSLPGTPSRLA
jgi:hypothetical protein